MAVDLEILTAFAAMIKSADLRAGIQLQPHQQRVADEVRAKTEKGEQARLLLYQGLGAGKTLSSLAGVDAAGRPFTAITPASLRENYRKEIDKFSDPLKTPTGAVMSYSALASGKPPPNPDSLVMDEAQALRNEGTKQTQQALSAAQKAKNLLLLSGTPIVNDPSDFAPLYTMLTGRSVAPEEFHQRYVREHAEHPSLLARLFGARTKQPGVKNEDELRQALAGHVDYYAGQGAPGVKVDRVDVPVEMSTDQARLYKAMYGKLPWLLRKKLEWDYPIEQDELRRLSGFLSGPRQVGLSTLPFTKGTQTPLDAATASPKISEALKHLQAKLKDPKAKALIFSNFVGSGLEPYRAALDKAGIPSGIFSGKLSDPARKQFNEDYNSGKIRAALLGPSGTEGLSFKGTRLIQLLDPHWNAVRGKQSVGRGLRFDSHSDLPEAERNVTVERYISRLPPSLLGRLGRKIGLPISSGEGADDYLLRMADRKDKINSAFTQLLQEIGTKKAASESGGLPAAR